MYQTHLLDLEKKEIEDNHESLVLLIMMVFLECNDLKENATGTHHLACQGVVVNQEHLVKTVNQDNQVNLV